MSQRFFKFRNYRNVGVSKEEGKFEEFRLNSSLEKENIGELIIVIGENNVGKSNILDGIAAIKRPESGEAVPLKKSDKPRFKYHGQLKPEIRLVYDGIDGKSCDVRYFLDDEGKGQFETSLEMEEKVIEVTKLKRQLSDKSIKAIKEEFGKKFNAYADRINEFTQRRGGGYDNSLSALKKSYNSIVADAEGVDVKKLKDAYEQLEKLLDNFVEAYNERIYYSSDRIGRLDFIDLDKAISYAAKDVTVKKAVNVPKDIVKEKYGISLVPKIIYYKEEEIQDDDLKTTPAAIKDSKFFNSLFKALGQSVAIVTEAYELAEESLDYKDDYAESINAQLKEIVSKKFNELYFQGLPSQEYNFHISLEKEQIYLGIRKNGNTITLSQQSTGFRWFFNFFFNFLYSNDLQAGDIVLMDEPEIHLAIPAKQDLRSFIKGFAKSSGITFIATTQHPEFTDPDFLDELRIVMQKKGEGEVGAKIENKFHAAAEDTGDTINAIAVAFGVNNSVIVNPDNRAVYVEGITDYNYLTAFKLLKEAEESKGDEKKKIGLAFLPIDGLGEDEAQMKRRLGFLARRRDAVVLADGDTAGEEFKKICEADAKAKSRVDVVLLKEADASFVEIEDLFAGADKERYKEMLEGKSGSASALFKRNIAELSQKGEIDAQTKANFYKVIGYLADLADAD